MVFRLLFRGVKDERSVRTLTLPEIGAAAKEVKTKTIYLQILYIFLTRRAALVTCV